MKRPVISLLKALPPMLLAFMAAACASMGRPTGGPRDVEPPQFVYSNPEPGSVNFKGNRVRVYFDENVQVKDAMTKVVVSPPQLTAPSISSNGHWVQVEMRDTMMPNTTYTIDFSDAISDLNEGNVLDGFAADFSTGPTIDTLSISGMVVKASNLEPAQGMLVGVYSNLADSAVSTLPMERVTKTNQYGRFTVRNLKPGSYRIFALNDLNRDYRWDRSEDVAFYDSIITPYTKPVTVTDTLSAADGSDSIVSRPGTAFYPDDILLTWFNENYKSHYLAKHERPERRKLNFEFGAPTDTFPSLRIVGSGKLDGLESEKWALRTSTVGHDTIEYWITDTLVAGIDSLTVAMTYERVDTLDRIVWTTDTIKMFLRGNLSRKAEAKRAEKEAERRRKALEKGDTLPEPEAPSLDVRLGGDKQDVNRPLTLEFQQPVTAFDPERIHLSIVVDSVSTPVAPPEVVVANQLNPRSMMLEYDWEPGAAYTLTIDSAAFTGVFGEVNKPVEKAVQVRKMEDYSTIRFNIEPQLPDSAGSVVVELLDKNDAPVARAAAVGGVALLEYLLPATYYARAFIDRNGNGVYDDGSLTDNRQPEEVVYYPKKLNLKKNWDIEQTWNIFETPLDLQKHLDIKKNKPAVKKDPNAIDDEDEEDEDDYYGPGGYGSDPFAPGGNNRYDRDDRRNPHNSRNRNNRY